jgi:hypothetical protein
MYLGFTVAHCARIKGRNFFIIIGEIKAEVPTYICIRERES